MKTNNVFLYKLNEIDDIDIGLDFIFNHIDNLLSINDYLSIDDIFTNIMDFNIILDHHYLVTILLSTLNNKKYLYSRSDFYDWVRALLILKLKRKEALDLLIGLK